MLSHPNPPIWQSGAKHRVRSSSQICNYSNTKPRVFVHMLTDCGSLFSASFSRTKSTTSWFVITSQIPSQAKTMNSWSEVNLSVITSGYAEKVSRLTLSILCINKLTGYDLLLCGLRFTSFECKISESSRKSQITIYTIEFNPSACSNNTTSLGLMRRLMIVG